MVKEDPEQVEGQSRQRERQVGVGIQTRGLAFQLAAVALVVVSLSATGFLMLRWLHAPQLEGNGSETNAAPGPAPSRLFYQWPRHQKPDLVLLLSGEQHGFLKFCGCSDPQYGGLERRYNFMQGLIKDRGWPMVALDLGDIAQRTSPQALLKYKYSMEGLNRLGYTAVGVGANEMALPLLDALAQFSLNNPSPRVLAVNLLNKDTNYPDPASGSMVGSWAVASKGNEPKVGVVGVVADSVAGPAQKQDTSVRFEPVEKSLPGVLKELQAKKPDLLVLLFQGTLDEAKACAARFPQFRVIVCLTQEEEPSGTPDKVGDTLIVGLGHKGRYVGLMGAYRTGKPKPAFDLYYELVQMGPEYETQEDQVANHPILHLLEDYTKEVKRGNYLAQYPKVLHPIQRAFPEAFYVGSEKCKKCHESAYQVWKDSPHSHAYDTLVKAKKPSLRQYDGECVSCHVTGFEYQKGFTDEMKTAHLENNGCENCHGPGSVHVKGNKTAQLRALMNPYKTPLEETPVQKNRRLLQLDEGCQKCHNIDNDVHWDIKKWQKIVHMTPADEKDEK